MAPGDPRRRPSARSWLCDHIEGANQHLRHHDVSLVVDAAISAARSRSAPAAAIR
ncbi:hypothetical protein [Bradyrhizobium sp. SZCCHNR1093]|uniref:hypothetical protein n=1 Tax=Bradyrhizobium sp. SZCCHNR1093 TaxID=3057368 RepID=UPI0028E5E00C|nr:hypothetical protein [Bradyrhizobium sp. SZCCHNR1093]